MYKCFWIFFCWDPQLLHGNPILITVLHFIMVALQKDTTLCKSVSLTPTPSLTLSPANNREESLLQFNHSSSLQSFTRHLSTRSLLMVTPSPILLAPFCISTLGVSLLQWPFHILPFSFIICYTFFTQKVLPTLDFFLSLISPLQGNTVTYPSWSTFFYR